MTQHASTYVLVLAATYPQLRVALEKLMGEPLNSASLEKFQGSLIYRTLMYDLQLIVQIHASNYNRINLSLTKIEEVISFISNINYAHLDDGQKKRLPELAKEIDAVHFHIREEVSPLLIAEKEKLGEQLTKQLQLSIGFLNNLDKVMNDALDSINREFKLEVKWTEGKTVRSWSQLKDWLERNEQIDKKIRETLLSIEDDENITNFLKAVLILEVTASLYQNKAVSSDSSKESQGDKVVKFVKNMVLQGVKFPKSEPKLGDQVEDMDKNSQKVDAIHEEVQTYPFKEEGEQIDMSFELEQITKDLGTFTTVDKPVKG